MFFDRLVSDERTLDHKQIDAVRERGQCLIKPGVRRKDHRLVAASNVDRAALRRVRRIQRDRLDTGDDLKRLESLDLDDLDRKALFEQTIIARRIEFLHQITKSNSAEYPQRFRTLLRGRSVFDPKQERRQAAAVIEVKMRDPDRVETYPIELFLRHSLNRRRRAVQQNRSAGCLKPIA